MTRGFELWPCSWTHTQRKQKYPHFITQSLMKSNSNTRSPKPRWIREVIPGQLLQPRDDVLLSTFLTSVALFDFMLKSCFTFFNLKLQKKALPPSLPPHPPSLLSSILYVFLSRGERTWTISPWQSELSSAFSCYVSLFPFSLEVCVCVCTAHFVPAEVTNSFFCKHTHAHSRTPSIGLLIGRWR